MPSAIGIGIAITWVSVEGGGNIDDNLLLWQLPNQFLLINSSGEKLLLS
jgi:hypothetical protein